jgi:hypothetical protein
LQASRSRTCFITLSWSTAAKSNLGGQHVGVVLGGESFTALAENLRAQALWSPA